MAAALRDVMHHQLSKVEQVTRVLEVKLILEGVPSSTKNLAREVAATAVDTGIPSITSYPMKQRWNSIIQVQLLHMNPRKSLT